ncbi:MAG: polysaccharide biosynthesis C-terminal domain-containing protein [Sphingobacteriaceae bacterium]|nr:polysaccharide biosynthesis C-terminal domain-containing protein [Sphingobacteriaceae bacterium]
MFSNILQSVFTKGFVAIINFLIFILSAKYLGASSRGEINIFVLNIAIIQILNEIYTGYSLIYFIPKYNFKKIFLTGILYTFMACTLGNSLFYSIGLQLPGYEWISYIISTLVILNTFNCVLILGKEKIGMYNFLCLFQPLLLLIGLCLAIFYLKNFTLEAYLYPMLLSFSLAFTISFFSTFNLSREHKEKNEFELKPILIYGFICQMGVLLYILSNKYSYYLLENNTEVGLYGTACSLIESVLIIANGVAPVFLARVANTGNSSYNVNMALVLSKASSLLSFIIIIIMLAIPNKLYVSILGTGYSEVKYYMFLYSPGILIMSFISILNNYFSAIGKLKQVLICNLAGFICSIIIAHVFIPIYGIKGAALAANIAYLVTAISIVSFFFYSNKLGIKNLFTITADINSLKK